MTKEAARQVFVNHPELWPTAEDIHAEQIRLAEIKALDRLTDEKRGSYPPYVE